MERLITFCALLFHSGFVASFPFPDGFNLAYQKPQYHYPSFTQPSTTIQQAQPQHYGNVDSYRSNPLYNNLQYQPAQPRSNYGTNYAYNTEQQALVTEVSSQEQIQERIEEQIKEQQALNEQMANQIRIQNAQHQQNLPVPESFVNSVPLPHSYQQVTTYPVSQSAPLYYPMEQQLPSINSQNQWVPEEREYAQTTNAGPEQDLEQQQQTQPMNTYRQIFDHYANQQSNQQPQVTWQNLWKKHSANTPLPKRGKKRYLVIHPDGRTEYVDKLEEVAKKHPNYVIVNAASLAGRNGQLATQTYPLQANPPSPQPILPSPEPEPNQPTSITKVKSNNSPSSNPGISSKITSPKPIPAPQNVKPQTIPEPQPSPIEPFTLISPGSTTSGPIQTSASTTPGTSGSSSTNPTPSSPIELLVTPTPKHPETPQTKPPVQAPNPESLAYPLQANPSSPQPILPSPEPEPNQTTSITEVESSNPPSSNSGISSKITSPKPIPASQNVKLQTIPEPQPSPTEPFTLTSPGSTTSGPIQTSASTTPGTSGSPSANPTPSSPIELLVTPTPKNPETPQTKPPVQAPNPESLAETKPNTPVETPKPDAPAKQTTTQPPSAPTTQTSPAPITTLPSEPESKPTNIPDSPIPTLPTDAPGSSVPEDKLLVAEAHTSVNIVKKDVTPAKSEPEDNVQIKSTKYTEVVTSTKSNEEPPPPGPLDLSKLNTQEPVTWFRSSDSDILSQLIGDEQFSVVYFIQVRSPPIVEKDIRTTVYPDGSKVEETIEKVKESCDAEPKVTKSVKVIPAGELE